MENETLIMRSFHISSLFKNVPLSEAIKICADALCESELNSPPFSINNEMYQQRDGDAIGSPLGPALANILVGFHKEGLFYYVRKPGIYFLSSIFSDNFF